MKNINKLKEKLNKIKFPRVILPPNKVVKSKKIYNRKRAGDAVVA